MITIYTSPTCGKCNMLKNMLGSINVEYTETQDMSPLQGKGFSSLPIIEENGEFYDFAAAWKKFNKEGSGI